MYRGTKAQRHKGTRILYFIFAVLCPVFFVIYFVSGCTRTDNPQQESKVIKTKSGVEMVVIPAGLFEMGDDKGSPDEKPAHKVWVNSFLMDKCEVPQEEFRKHQISDPSHFKNPKNPLEQMNWSDAAMYCNDRSYAEGLQECYNEKTWDCNFMANGYRLPTEAEWEYACRAGTNTQYSFGNDARSLAEYAWFTQNSSEKTHLIGQKKPNQWGLYDMYGNVTEWCNDWYQKDYYKNSPQRNPTGPAKGKERVLRGGSWSSTAQACRSTYRSSDPAIDDTCLSSSTIGFRCVRNVPSEQDVNMPKIALAGLTMNTEKPKEKSYKTGLVFHDIYLEHKTPASHSEQPARLNAIIENLQSKGLYSQLLPITALPNKTMIYLTMVHSTKYIEQVESLCKKGGGSLSSDTPVSAKSYQAAITAVDGVLAAIDAVMNGKVQNAFCAVRPPGHHAEKDKAMGFCVFNNVAAGAEYLKGKYRLHKILIVDWDVHHGNGTQNAFYKDPDVLYFSVHRGNFYPYTGSQAEKGEGPGLNHIINVPLSAGATDANYIKVFEEIFKPVAEAFKPEFVLISAGFDAHKDDPLGGMKVTEDGYAKMTRIVKQIAQTFCQGRIVSVLEGGYNLKALANSVETHIRVLME
jgi:acetoin utilization deacetylase AcuC-like enzyme/formylglycine-generating enzyme required for sulfatase activity